jgi:cytoskeletal protein CcmA (bactofilin family)
MKKILLGLVAVFVVVPLFVGASTFQSGNTYSLNSSEVVSSDLYAAGGSVSVDGVVRGDAIVAGGMVSITGSTTQDVMAAGGNLLITGQVGDDVRAVGGNLTVGGTIVGDIILTGGQLATLSSTVVGGDAVLTGGSVVFNGRVQGKAIISGGEISLNGRIEGPVEIYADTITISRSAVIVGGLTYSSPKEATIENGAQITGGITYKPIAARTASSYIFPTLVKFFMLFVSALVLGLALKRIALRIISHTHTGPGFWWSLLRGLIFLIVTPFAFIILCITVVGVPLGIILLLIYILSLILAWIFTAIVAGAYLNRWIFKQSDYDITWQTIFLGSLLVIILGVIPFIGPLAIFVLMLVALGALFKQGSEWVIRRNINL